MVDLRQEELKQWMEQNFGTHDDDILKCALGMAEEVGEVCHHILKGTQNIRGGIDGINKKEVADGVADTLIYGIQLLSKLGMDAEHEIELVIHNVLARDWKKNPTGDKCRFCGGEVHIVTIHSDYDTSTKTVRHCRNCAKVQ